MRKFFSIGFTLQLALVVTVSAGAYLGLLPTSLPSFEGADKVGHFFLIGLLGFFLDGALGQRNLVHGRFSPPLALVVVLTAAGIEEYLQRLSPRRDSSWFDFLADVLGVAFFTVLSRVLVAHAGRSTASRHDGSAPEGHEVE